MGPAFVPKVMKVNFGAVNAGEENARSAANEYATVFLNVVMFATFAFVDEWAFGM